VGLGLIRDVRNHVPAAESRKQTRREEVVIIEWRQSFQQAAMTRKAHIDIDSGLHLKDLLPPTFSALSPFLKVK
jgi:hypothetical protein